MVTHIYSQGNQISLWNHNWGHGIMRHQLPSLFTHAIHTDTTLKEAMQGMSENLFQKVLTLTAQQELVSLRGYLARVEINTQQDQDGIQWNRAELGIFTVKSAYRAIKNGPYISTNAHHLWKLQVPPRIKVFGWLLVNNKLLTIDNLRKKGWPITNMCIMCRRDAESAHHMLGECTLAKEMYHRIDIAPHMKLRPIESLTQLANSINVRGNMLNVMFVIWRERCARIFRESSRTLEELLYDVAQLLESCPETARQD